MKYTIDLKCANCGENEKLDISENCGTIWIECLKCNRTSWFSPDTQLCEEEDAVPKDEME